MPAIVHSVDIVRSPDEVFSCVTDLRLRPEWQESLVRAYLDGNEPMADGSTVTETHRIGRGERTITTQVTAWNPPHQLAFGAEKGPICPHGEFTVDDIGGGRSRLTLKLDLEGRGIGRLLVPLVVRRQLQDEVPKNLYRLKALLERS